MSKRFEACARPHGGVRRIWPRGKRRDEWALDGWLRDVAPSTELRT